MKRQQFHRFICFAQNTGVLMRGKSAKLYNDPKWEVNYLYNGQLSTSCRTRTFSSSSLSSTSRWTDSSNYSRKLGTLSDPVTTRSDKHACGKPMLTDPDKQAAGNREPAYIFLTRSTRRIQRKAFLFAYSPSQIIWRTWRRMCSHIPLKERTQIRKVMLQK